MNSYTCDIGISMSAALGVHLYALAQDPTALSLNVNAILKISRAGVSLLVIRER